MEIRIPGLFIHYLDMSERRLLQGNTNDEIVYCKVRWWRKWTCSLNVRGDKGRISVERAGSSKDLNDIKNKMEGCGREIGA
ncbi:hypothetical protein CGSHi22421_09601 [Haemophilus influenzae R3021]|uniref:Uncharacterized protein n=1 Tax=Haemophilus influenzae R3021 TaxID=375432 RepID=A4N7B1_HAEIF|nr:hypothetical protein CGSHi22421_09601 [Haemophilus influenzae R3021]